MKPVGISGMPHPMTGFYEGPTTRFILTARWLPFAARVHRSIDPRAALTGN